MLNFKLSALSALCLARSAFGGTTVWSGSFNYYNTVADFDTCMPFCFISVSSLLNCVERELVE
jgi:hypothetical protein